MKFSQWIEGQIERTIGKNPDEFFREGQIERVISGGLLDSITTHGPITKNLVNSAAKRMANQLRAFIVQYGEQKLIDKAQQITTQKQEQYMNELKERIVSLQKQRDDLLLKLKTSGLL